MATRREAAAQTREALLHAGEELLVEVFTEGRLDPAQVLRPSVIAERAGFSKGMLYHLWPVSEGDPDRLGAYRAELLSRQGWWKAIDVETIVAQAEGQPDDSGPQFVRRMANLVISAVAPGGERAAMHRIVAMLSIAAEARHQGRDGDPAGAGQERRQDPALDELYALTVRAYGREMVPPLTTAHLGAMLWAALDGVAVNLVSSPALADEVELEGDEGVWSSYALIVDAIVQRVTRPIG